MPRVHERVFRNNNSDSISNAKTGGEIWKYGKVRPSEFLPSFPCHPPARLQKGECNQSLLFFVCDIVLLFTF